MLLDFVDNYPKMSHLLKKLAFTEVYILASNNQVTQRSAPKNPQKVVLL